MNFPFKISVTILIFQLFTYQLRSQTTDGFKGGLLGGFCTSQIDGDKLAGYNKLGATAGFFVKRVFSENIQAQMEMRYNQKGAATYKNTPKYRARLNYIEIPIMGIYSITKTIAVEAGIQPSYLYRAVSLLGSLEIKSYYRPIDVPLAVGAYYSINNKMKINVRYSYSTISIQKNTMSNNLVYYGYNSFNNAINFVLYYNVK